MLKEVQQVKLLRHVSAIAWIFLFLINVSSAGKPPKKEEINNYIPIFLPLYDNYNQLKIAIRSYDKAQIPHLVLVDPYTLKTQVAQAATTKSILGASKTLPVFISLPPTLNNTPYINALQKYVLPPYKLQNYGAAAALYKTNGVFLTIDMCPSTKEFAKSFFEKLLSLRERNQRAIPIAISVSGRWMLQHTAEFAWLKEQFFSDKLDITWVNHSFSHPYVPGRANKDNFLLIHEERFEQEVLQTEKILLENHLVPSVFFRYPGLIANETLIKKLNKLSLIPLGSNAWLAKGQHIKPGAFILVHGNGNEPCGIKIGMSLLPHLLLLPITQAFIPLQSEFNKSGRGI